MIWFVSCLAMITRFEKYLFIRNALKGTNNFDDYKNKQTRCEQRNHLRQNVTSVHQMCSYLLRFLLLLGKISCNVGEVLNLPPQLRPGKGHKLSLLKVRLSCVIGWSVVLFLWNFLVFPSMIWFSHLHLHMLMWWEIMKIAKRKTELLTVKVMEEV